MLIIKMRKKNIPWRLMHVYFCPLALYDIQDPVFFSTLINVLFPCEVLYKYAVVNLNIYEWLWKRTFCFVHFFCRPIQFYRWLLYCEAWSIKKDAIWKCYKINASIALFYMRKGQWHLRKWKKNEQNMLFNIFQTTLIRTWILFLFFFSSIKPFFQVSVFFLNISKSIFMVVHIAINFIKYFFKSNLEGV